MVRINLALQGGGAHGAYTWGVLDRLLQEEDVEIAAISGTSAGAVNGAALKAGWNAGGREAARDKLRWLWETLGAEGDPDRLAWLNAVSPPASLMAHALEYSPLYAAMDVGMRMFSPYASGPLYRNPLRPILEEFDWEDVCGTEGPCLHVCATNVRTGKIRVFKNTEVHLDAVLASACLPTMFQAVECHDPKTGRDEAYWDGGYIGNPALFPLFEPEFPDDVVIVNINPLYRETLPTDPVAIQNRINEISFNSSLLRELRAIDFVKRLIEDGKMEAGKMKDVLVHMISDDELMNRMNVATKLIPNPVILDELFTAGRDAASAFLEAHLDDLGKRSTVDLRQMFQ